MRKEKDSTDLGSLSSLVSCPGQWSSDIPRKVKSDSAWDTTIVDSFWTELGLD